MTSEQHLPLNMRRHSFVVHPKIYRRLHVQKSPRRPLSLQLEAAIIPMTIYKIRQEKLNRQHQFKMQNFDIIRRQHRRQDLG